ncbi:MAG: ComEC/Rec2 family competence protein [Clostridia bacterium]|nr:ComEC/Rec2 family competence protein [Clostridia bacterium]
MKKFVNFRPIFFASLCAMLGIVDAYFFVMKNYLLSIILLAIFVILITLFIIKSNGKLSRRFFISITLFLIATLFALNFSFNVNSYINADLKTQRLLITGTVSEIQNTENGERITMKDNTAKGTFSGKLKYNVLVYVDGETDYDVGDVLYFYGDIYDNDYIYEARFESYKIADKTKYFAFIDNTDLLKAGEKKTVFDRVRLSLRDTLKANLSEDGFSIAYALLLGDSDYIDNDIITNFRSAGVAHIFAVSGLHIGFLATIFYFVLKKLRVNGFLSVIICASVLLIYSGVCGFSSSSIRAVIMSVVLLLSTVFGKKYDMLSSISLASLIILFISPVQLFCVGFQLSFGVVLGIMLLGKKFALIIPVKNDKISNLIGGVISAQLISVPICLYAFNEFSLIAIIANLLFIPVVGVIYSALFIVSVVVLISGLNFLFFPLNYVVLGVIYLIKAFDYTVFMVGGITFGLYSLFYYGALILAADLINLKTIVKRGLICLFALVFACGTTLLNVRDINGEKCYIIGDRDICATLFTGKDDNTLIISNVKNNFSLKRVDRCLKKSYNKKIDRVIIANSEQTVNADRILAKLYAYYGVKKAVLYDGVDEEYKTALSKMFFNTEIIYLYDGDTVKVRNSTFSYDYGGYAVKYKNGAKNIIIFSALDRGIMNKEDEIEYGALIATDYVEILKSRFKSENLIAYNLKNYTNAYYRGNYLIKIS